MHSLIVPTFFLTNNTGAPHRDTLFSMNFSSINSSSCTLSSTNSASDIRYDGIAIGVAPGIRSMVNSVSLTGGNPGNISGNTSWNSVTTGGYLISPLSASPSHMFAIIGAVCLGIPRSPSNFSTSPPGILNSTLFLWQSTFALNLANQFMPIITSNPDMSIRIRSNWCSYPDILKVQLRQFVLNSTLPFKGVITIRGFFIRCVASCSDFENCIDIKECDAPGSNNTLAKVFKIKIVPQTIS